MTIARRAKRLGGGTWRETSVPVQDLSYAVRQLAGKLDVYLTQNRFFGRRRLVTRVAELDALFVDLDFHQTAHAGSHPRQVLELALGMLKVAKIPCSSLAVSTGRGLALVWLHRRFGCTDRCRARRCPAGVPASKYSTSHQQNLKKYIA